jgi:hypothetical protein
MPLAPRSAPPAQRLVVRAPVDASAPLSAEAVGAPVEFLFASRESLLAGKFADPHGATSAIYVLIGGPEVALGPGDPVKAYDDLLGRSPSLEPPGEADAVETLDSHQHTAQWRARSAGCLRMRNEDIARLLSAVPLGATMTVRR